MQILQVHLLGHGHGAIIGDVISNILKWNGYKVDREYYYNNAGRQMRILGESLKSRYYESLNLEYRLSRKMGIRENISTILQIHLLKNIMIHF